MAAFQKLCEHAGYRAIRAQIDDSEFPYLVYGAFAGRCEYATLRDAFGVVPDYLYVGCLMVPNPDDTYTVFALNMTPRHRYPQDRQSQTRLMRRMRLLAASQR